MITRLRNLIVYYSSGKTVLVFFILSGIFYTTMLAFTIPKVSAFANGMKILDMIPEGYDKDYVDTLFAALGENGRFTYLYKQIPLDLIFPALFGIGFCLLFAFILPLIASISDYVENIGIITMLRQFPNYSDETVTITSTFSFLKSSTITIYFIALIFLLVAFGVQYVKSKRSETVLG
jgi:small-conductance mechanosensitive channel